MDRSGTRKVIQFNSQDMLSVLILVCFATNNRQVNQSHFKSSSWNSYFNVTKTINHSQTSIHEFPSVVTSTVDGKLRNKNDNSKVICICKVGNMKFYALIGLILATMLSIIVFITFFIRWSDN